MAGRSDVQVNTEDDKSPVGTSDDKCIGNRKIRTVILCLILLTFSVFAAGYLSILISRAKDKVDVTTGCSQCEEAGDSRVHGANLIFAGLIFMMLFLCVTMVVAVLPMCDVNTIKMGRVPAGLGLIFGATLYILGWIWYIGSDKEINYNFLSDEKQEEQDAIYLAWFGECLLYSATVILLGVDLLIPHRFLLEDEYKRLFLNLTLLSVVSILTMPAYFILEKGTTIGVGYIFIFIPCVIYIVLFLLTCCTNDAKDKMVVRASLAIFMMIGGVITAIGYYVYAGEVSTLGDSGDDAKRVAYYIGYTGLVGGLCSVWALDIVWDDVKANNK